MRKAQRHISLIAAASLLWMILLPVVSVCGMMTDLMEASEATVVSCCPTLPEKDESQTQDSPQKMDCHPVQDAQSHSCEICPCEFRASMVSVKSLSLITPEAQKLSLLTPVSTFEITTPAVDADLSTLPFLELKPDSGPPIFIRNCVYLI